MQWLAQIFHFGSAGMAGYAALSVVLWTVAVYAVWRGWTTRFKLALLSLVHSLMFFTLARLPFWRFAPETAAASYPGILHFSVLSLVGFYFLSLLALKLEVLQPLGNKLEAESAGSAAPKLPDRLLREMLFLGLILAFAFLAVSYRSSAVAVVVGFVNWLAVGAAARLLAFTLGKAFQGPRELIPLALAAGISWLSYETVVLAPWNRLFDVLHAARWLDIIAIALAPAAVIGVYVRWGSSGESRAREMETEMEAAKSELARLNRIAKDIYEDSNELMIKQKQQALASARRAEGLEKVLQVGTAIQQRRKLDDVLQMIVEFIQTQVGFKTVTLRLLNAKTQSFEMRAHMGLNPQIRDRIVSYRVPMSEFERMTDPKLRISKSYFIKGTAPVRGEDPSGEDPMLVQNTWGEIEMLIVPLSAEDGPPVGYLTVERPDDLSLSLGYVIEVLERIAMVGVIGIRNARTLELLKEKDEKLKDFTEKLTNLNRMKSNFVATMSHEFRTPLTSIKAYCDTLIKNADSVDRNLLKEFLHVIDEESDRLMTLVEDILDFSQIESGAMQFERRPCDLKQVVTDAASELAKNFELKEIAFHQDLPEGKVVVHGEQDLMKQLVVSLLHNASKFCNPRGNVWVRLEDEVSAARIVVEDDGVGIPEDQLEKIFDQFYQVDSSATREHGGSGLGLALCRSIVEWHNGRIWVQNITGGGARFVAVIPKKQAVTRSHVMGITSTVRRLEVEKFLELVVESIAELMTASKVSLMLADADAGELRIEAAIGVQEAVVEHSRVKIGEGISGKVLSSRRSMLVADIETDERVARNNNEPVYGSKSFLCVPIVGEGEALGVINVSSPAGRESFVEKDRLLLEVLAKRVAAALYKIREFKDVSDHYERVVDTYKAILESKRFVGARDDERMTTLVAKVADKLGLDAETRSAMPYVMAVYDLGLSKVGSHILNKPAALSGKDREEIENHTVAGNELLGAIESEPKIREIVLYHHENFDGSGYPGRLKGKSIPLGARIVRVADSLKALISERAYQRRYTFEEAIEILKHRAGAFYDPQVVEAFIEAIGEGRNKPSEPSRDEPEELAGAGFRDRPGHDESRRSIS